MLPKGESQRLPKAEAGNGLAGRLEAERLRDMCGCAAGGASCGALPGGFQLWGAFGSALLIQADAPRAGVAGLTGEGLVPVEQTLAET